MSRPEHLLAKLRHDYGRVTRKPDDCYAAFDFFVTANSMVDWVWPSATAAQQNRDRRADALPRICEHLANGAKHFVLTRPSTHVAVTDLKVHKGAFSEAFSDAFDVGMLMVALNSDEAAELEIPTIPAHQLARRVLNYWEKRCGEPLT